MVRFGVVLECSGMHPQRRIPKALEHQAGMTPTACKAANAKDESVLRSQITRQGLGWAFVPKV